MAQAALSVVTVTFLVACGGSDGGGSGHGGAGGAGGAGGGTGATGAVGGNTGGTGALGTGAGAGSMTATGGQASDRCPAGPPVTGDGCGPEGLTCTYAGSPCGTLAQCTSGLWDARTTCPPEEACPTVMPSDGEPCDFGNPAAGPLTCPFDRCPEGTLPGPRYEATCDGTSWAVRERDCPEAVECGECPPGTCCDGDCAPGEWIGRNHCAVGEICMRVLNERGDYSWDCAPNQCDPDPLDCSCVGDVCSQRGFPGDWQCTTANAPVITCECVSGC